ncbi:MAG: TetR/AcrR family transcriptional regulator [Planctomycetes bacterium]|nr:TetR/AcrR family transcriptional regulator [Planctomycetota bacterium]
MPRPDRSNERRRELLPVLASAFAELGFRRATTAELAKRCGVQETQLYRLWPDKRAMFVAAIEHVYDESSAQWERLLTATAGDGRESAAERLFDHEARHHGQLGLYRIVFAGLSETDDPQIRDALRRSYARYHAFVTRRLEEHGADGAAASRALALLGLGTISSIGRELGLLDEAERTRLWHDVGRLLLGERRVH